MIHYPVLQKEVIEYLDPKPNENFIDATYGSGGHTAAIIEKIKPEGKILGIEVDSEFYLKLKSQMAEIPNSKSQISKRLILVNDSYINLKEIAEREKFKPVHGILFDLGMSSWHLEQSKRGFSFKRDEPLDMRYSFGNNLTAREIVNEWPQDDLEKIIMEYGEERFARRITRAILEARKIKLIETTFELVEIIKMAVPSWYLHRRISPATKTFQALRIAVNDELNNLKKTLPQALEILQAGGRLAVISFHSLEDRIVKCFFKEEYRKQAIKILTKKAIRPTIEEIKENPRARSAKLRAIVKYV